MGILKKRPDEAEPADEPADAADVAGEEQAGSGGPGAGEPQAVTPDEAPAAAEESAPPAGDDASDALLSMFHESDSGSGDREMLLQMAGEVELPDLVDQLRTVAAALNIASARAR